MERVKMGYLLIGKKVHAVYEGLNTIGRDKEATVIIKDLGVSHQHAILTILHNRGHFISDFRSSNGTTLDRRKLRPLELHEIKDGSIITFSNNVQATYCKISENSSLLDTNLTLQNTQVDDNFYAANTQLISENDITNVSHRPAVASVDEIPDDDLDFSNINTQFAEEVIAQEITIHEMPTQMYHKEAGVVDFHDLPTQLMVVNDQDEDKPSTSTHNNTTTTTRISPAPGDKDDSETQLFDPIHEAATQIINLPNCCDVEEIGLHPNEEKEETSSQTSIHEAATQIFECQNNFEALQPNAEASLQTGIREEDYNVENGEGTSTESIYEAATQITNYNGASREMQASIHEEATQIINDNGGGALTEAQASIDEEATQIVDWADIEDADMQIQAEHIHSGTENLRVRSNIEETNTKEEDKQRGVNKELKNHPETGDHDNLIRNEDLRNEDSRNHVLRNEDSRNEDSRNNEDLEIPKRRKNEDSMKNAQINNNEDPTELENPESCDNEDSTRHKPENPKREDEDSTKNELQNPERGDNEDSRGSSNIGEHSRGTAGRRASSRRVATRSIASREARNEETGDNEDFTRNELQRGDSEDSRDSSNIGGGTTGRRASSRRVSTRSSASREARNEETGESSNQFETITEEGSNKLGTRRMTTRSAASREDRNEETGESHLQTVIEETSESHPQTVIEETGESHPQTVMEETGESDVRIEENSGNRRITRSGASKEAGSRRRSEDRAIKNINRRNFGRTQPASDSDSRESFNSVDSDPQSQLHTSQLRRRADRCLRSDEDRSSVDSDRQSQLHTSQIKRSLRPIESDEESQGIHEEEELQESTAKKSLGAIETDKKSQGKREEEESTVKNSLGTIERNEKSQGKCEEELLEESTTTSAMEINEESQDKHETVKKSFRAMESDEDKREEERTVKKSLATIEGDEEDKREEEECNVAKNLEAIETDEESIKKSLRSTDSNEESQSKRREEGDRANKEESDQEEQIDEELQAVTSRVAESEASEECSNESINLLYFGSQMVPAKRVSSDSNSASAFAAIFEDQSRQSKKSNNKMDNDFGSDSETDKEESRLSTGSKDDKTNPNVRSDNETDVDEGGPQKQADGSDDETDKEEESRLSSSKNNKTNSYMNSTNETDIDESGAQRKPDGSDDETDKEESRLSTSSKDDKRNLNLRSDNETDVDESGAKRKADGSDDETDKEESRLPTISKDDKTNHNVRNDKATDVDEIAAQRNGTAEVKNAVKQAEEDDTDVEDNGSSKNLDESSKNIDGSSKSPRYESNTRKMKGIRNSEVGTLRCRQDLDGSPPESEEDGDGRPIRRSRRCKASKTKEDRDKSRRLRSSRAYDEGRSRRRQIVSSDDSDSNIMQPRKSKLSLTKKPVASIEDSTSGSNCEAKIEDSDTDIEGNLKYNVISNKSLNSSSDLENVRRSFLDVTDDIIPATPALGPLDVSSDIIPATQEEKKRLLPSSEESFKLGLTQFMEDSTPEDSQNPKKLYVIKDLEDDEADDDLLARSQRAMDKLNEVVDELNNAACKSGETSTLQIATKGLIEATNELNKGLVATLSGKLERTISHDKLSVATHRLQVANDKMASRKATNLLQSDEDDELFGVATQKTSSTPASKENLVKIEQDSSDYQMATQTAHLNKEATHLIIHKDDHHSKESQDKKETKDKQDDTDKEDTTDEDGGKEINATQIEDFNQADTSSFIAATQEDNLHESNKDATQTYKGSNIFLVATQKASHNQLAGQNEDATQTYEDSNIFLEATQKADSYKTDVIVEDLEATQTDEDSSIFALATQKADTQEATFVAPMRKLQLKHSENEDVFLAATQTEDVSNVGIEDEDATQRYEDATQTVAANEDEDTNVEDEVKDISDSSIFLVATQKANVTYDDADTDTEEAKDVTDSSIFLLATQKADAINEGDVDDADTDTEEARDVTDSNIFLLATQKADAINEVDVDDADTDKEEARDITDSSIFLLATQKAALSEADEDDDNIKSPSKHRKLASKFVSSDEDDDIFGVATQQSKPFIPKLGKHLKKSVNDDEVAMQQSKLTLKLEKNIKESVNDDEVATQESNPALKLEKKIKESVNDDEVATQQSKPALKLEKKIKESVNHTQKFSEATREGIFLVPRQKLDVQDESLVATQKFSGETTSDDASLHGEKLEAIFEMATQQVTKDPLSSKSDVSRKRVSFGTIKFHDEDSIEVTKKKVDEEDTSKKQGNPSEAEIIIKDGNEDEISNKNEEAKKEPEVESQLEVLFATQTLHAIEEDSDRPKNPLVSSFRASCTQDIVNELSLIHGSEEASLDTQDVLQALSSNEEAKSNLKKAENIEVIHSTQDVVNILSSSSKKIDTKRKEKKTPEENELKTRPETARSSKLSLKSVKFNQSSHPTHSSEDTAKPNFKKLSLSTVKQSTSKGEESTRSRPLISSTYEEEVLVSTATKIMNPDSIVSEEAPSRSKRSVKSRSRPLISSASEEEVLVSTVTKIMNPDSIVSEDAPSRSKRSVKSRSRPLISSTSEEEVLVSTATKIMNPDSEEAPSRSKRSVKPLTEEESFTKPVSKRHHAKEESFTSTSANEANKSNLSLPDSSFTRKKVVISITDDEDEDITITVPKQQITLKIKGAEEPNVKDKQSVAKNQTAQKIARKQAEEKLKVPARRGRKKKSPEPEPHLESKRRKADPPDEDEQSSLRSEENTKIGDSISTEIEEKLAPRRGRSKLENQETKVPARRGRSAASKDSQDSEKGEDLEKPRKQDLQSIGEESERGQSQAGDKDFEATDICEEKQIAKPRGTRRQTIDEDFEDKEETAPKRTRLRNIESAPVEVSTVRTRRVRKNSVKEAGSAQIVESKKPKEEVATSKSHRVKEESTQVTTQRVHRGRKAAELNPQIAPQATELEPQDAKLEPQDTELEPQVSGSKLQRSKRSVVIEDAGRGEEMQVGSKRGRKAPTKEAVEDTPMLAKRSRKFEDNDSVASSSALSTPKKRNAASLSSTPSKSERAKRKLKPKIVFTMLDSPELCTLIRSLGGLIVDSLEASTVLVTKSILRTQKLLCAIGLGKPICSPDWLYACKKANTFLDPWDHLIQDPEAEKKWNFSLQESFDRSRSEKLFDQYTFQLIVNNAADVLKGAIEACGGKCCGPRAPKSGNFIVIASPENKAKCARFIKQQIQIVLPEAIFEGVLRQEIVFNKHLLNF